MNRLQTLSLIIICITVDFGCSKTPVKPLVSIPDGFENPLKVCPASPNCYRATYVFENTDSTFTNTVENVLKELKATETKSDKLLITSTFKIPVFGWLDDVLIQLQPCDRKKTYVHIRSSSRVGYSDLGVNKRRVGKIISKIFTDYTRSAE